MSDKFTREIQKFKVRLEDFVRKNDEYVEGMRSCLGRFIELDVAIVELRGEGGAHRFEELKKLRLETIRALEEAMTKGGEAEHEGSHILESYGALILALEEEFQGIA